MPLTALLLAAAAAVTPAWQFEEARQFDFWIGEWDVNLRIRQDDGSWPESVAARAHVHRILDGKAILELWDSEPIKGFSLRWFDRGSGEWKLWLNWPGRNTSGGSGLSGSFHHGRGEFFSRTQRPDGGTSISRYTFSDITRDSLRWDDAFSKDGGKSWTHGWIMEFSRTEARPPALTGTATHTYDGGTRCDLPEFRTFEALIGVWQGEFDGVPATLRGFKTLDGCAMLVFVEAGALKQFRFLTWNTYAGAYEENLLDNAEDTNLVVSYGRPPGEDGVLTLGPQRGTEGPTFAWALGAGRVRVTRTEPDGATSEAVFRRPRQGRR